MAQILQWNPTIQTANTTDTTTWNFPTIERQEWVIKIKIELPEYDVYGDCGGYIP